MAAPNAPRRRTRSRTGALAGLGELVSARRLALGLTQADLADLAGVGISSVHALESGKDTVRIGIALRVLDAAGLGVAVGERPALERAGALLVEPGSAT